ncbi:MAG: class I SAM-dependent methyltransferase, partial [archaeon]
MKRMNAKNPLLCRPKSAGKFWEKIYSAKIPAVAINNFKWHEKAFLSGITPKTKVLEIGAGSGRLVEFLLKRTNLRPENLAIADLTYGTIFSPALKRKVYSLVAKGKIRILSDNFESRNKPFLGGEKFDKIILSNFFVVKPKVPAEGVLSEHMHQFRWSFENLFPLMKVNGELFISEVRRPSGKFLSLLDKWSDEGRIKW